MSIEETTAQSTMSLKDAVAAIAAQQCYDSKNERAPLAVWERNKNAITSILLTVKPGNIIAVAALVEDASIEENIKKAVLGFLCRVFLGNLPWFKRQSGWYYDTNARAGSGAVTVDGPFCSLRDCEIAAAQTVGYHNQYGLQDVRPYKKWQVDSNTAHRVQMFLKAAYPADYQD